MMVTGAVLTLSLLVGSGAASGEELVIFEDTRSLRVASATRTGGVWLLDLGQGNQVSVPAGKIARVKKLPNPPEPEPPKAWQERARGYARFIEAAASKFRLEPELLVAVAVAESALNPLARSEKGALGVMQIMPDTAVELGLEDPFDAQRNIDAGARYLREMLDLFENDLELALAAYNAGQGAVRRYGGVPPFPETRAYLGRVRRLFDDLRAGVPEAP
jgi:soluble lytic murein transglycosylase-like protein